jgi:hypothetical protein
VPTIAAAINAPIAALFTSDDQTAIADVIVTGAALERIRTQGEPALEQLIQHLTTVLRARLAVAADNAATTDRDAARARSRRAEVQRARLDRLNADTTSRRRLRVLPPLEAL